MESLQSHLICALERAPYDYVEMGNFLKEKGSFKHLSVCLSIWPKLCSNKEAYLPLHASWLRLDATLQWCA
jgi:hypothetical protein